jgi:hypothetical protein
MVLGPHLISILPENLKEWQTIHAATSIVIPP